MNATGRKPLLLKKILKGLFFYVLVPALLLWLLAPAAGEAVRGSDPAALLILLAALAVVGLNWRIGSVLRTERPSLLVFSYGFLCLLIFLRRWALSPAFFHSAFNAFMNGGKQTVPI